MPLLIITIPAGRNDVKATCTTVSNESWAHSTSPSHTINLAKCPLRLTIRNTSETILELEIVAQEVAVRCTAEDHPANLERQPRSHPSSATHKV